MTTRRVVGSCDVNFLQLEARTVEQIVNRNELRIIGMSRSGNHAVIQWLTAQIPGRACFLNCAEGKNNPFASARVMDDGRTCIASYDDFDLEQEQKGQFSSKDYLIFSHEDGYLGRSCSREYEQSHDQWVGPSGRRTDILILRDPFNLFASRLRQLWGFVTIGTSARIWKQHAREFLRQTRRLRHNPMFISYNHWHSDRDYRRDIAAALDIPFSDEGIHTVFSCNGGSSFDGVAFDGQASRMKVTERWKHYADDPRFLSIFDDEMLELSRRIFGDIPGTEALVKAQPLARAG
jgi:hypothetical protein